MERDFRTSWDRALLLTTVCVLYQHGQPRLYHNRDMCTLDKHTQAKVLYTGPGRLAAKLKAAGWNVKDELETVVLGHRGVVSKQNLDAYKNLVIAKGKLEGLQNRLALSAIT